MRVTSHNGRSGKHGAYNPKHNDRQFDMSKSEHIDEVRAMENVYWDYQRGYRLPRVRNDGISFEEIELQFYQDNYGEYIKNQNARNEMNRHPERNRSIEDLYHNDKTCPEETIYQIGNIDMSVSAETLLQIASEFFAEREKLFGSYVEMENYFLEKNNLEILFHELGIEDDIEVFLDKFCSFSKMVGGFFAAKGIYSELYDSNSLTKYYHKDSKEELFVYNFKN